MHFVRTVNRHCQNFLNCCRQTKSPPRCLTEAGGYDRLAYRRRCYSTFRHTPRR